MASPQRSRRSDPASAVEPATSEVEITPSAHAHDPSTPDVVIEPLPEVLPSEEESGTLSDFSVAPLRVELPENAADVIRDPFGRHFHKSVREATLARHLAPQGVSFKTPSFL